MLKIGFIGAGNMATALLKGIVADNICGPAQITMSDPDTNKLEALKKEFGVNVTTNNNDVVCNCDTVIIAVKPQIAPAVLGALNSAPKDTLFISIMAGLSIHTIEKLFTDKVKLVRAMTNSSAFVRKGSTALSKGVLATESDMVKTENIFRCVGSVYIMKESYLNAVMGVSGCGPAYFYIIIEALSDAGVKAGLSRAEALSLAAETAAGAAAMVLETKQHPAALKDMVTSPGGTTIAAIQVLEEAGLRAALMNAVEAAIYRAEELEGQ